MQGKHSQEKKGGRWGGEACFGNRLMGWMKERKSGGRSEGGRREVSGVAWVKGEALCVGSQEAFGLERMAGGNDKRAK